VQIIPSKHLKLIREIGSGPGYFLHAVQNQGHAAIIKVFNRGPNVRQVSKELGQDRYKLFTYIWAEATGINGGLFKGSHVCTTGAVY
jgi:hypothetical protein